MTIRKHTIPIFHTLHKNNAKENLGQMGKTFLSFFLSQDELFLMKKCTGWSVCVC